jgi:hypothetical protein
MRGLKLKSPSRRIWAVIVALVALTLGKAEHAAAQDVTDFTDCVQPGSPWVFCTPKFNMPIGAPEVSLAPTSSAPGWIVYNSNTQLLTADGSGGMLVYFNTLGNYAAINGGTLSLRARFTQDGKFAGGAGGACGVATDDFCITGSVIDAATGISYGQGGTIVRGRVVHGGFKKNAIIHQGASFDDYEFHVLLTGGDLYTNKILPMYGSNEFAVELFGYNDGVSYTGDNPFAFAGFSQTYVMAFSGPTNTTGILFDDLCDGRINGSVTDYFNPLMGVNGAEIQLTGSPNLVPATNGAYGATNLCRGTYQVRVLPPVGWLVSGADTATVTISKMADGHNSVISNVNFKLYSTPINGNFITFTQGAWGTKPRGSNAGALLTKYFDLVYPEEVVVGIPDTVGRYSVTLTGAAAVTEFLPQNGPIIPLYHSYVDPPSIWKWKHRGKWWNHRKVSELAGEVVALELNVRFSAFNITKAGLGSLKVQSGLLAGKTVDEVLALANRVLGGDPLPTGMKYTDLESIVEKINKNFEAGSPSKGYVK